MYTNFKYPKYIRLLLIILIISSVVYNLYKFVDFKQIKLQFESFTTEISDIVIERKDFDCYVINLKKNTERLFYITDKYNTSDLATEPFIRIEAVNGKEIDIQPYVTDRVYKGIQNINKTGARTYHSQISAGAIGCYLSHIDIYLKILNSDKPYALILEDDAQWLTPDIYNSGIRDILKIIPNDWDIILLGRLDLNTINKESYLEMHEFWGTHGYLINKQGAIKMLSLASVPIDDQIDAVMGKLKRAGKLHIYAPVEVLIHTNAELGSEIQIPITLIEGVDPNTDAFK